MSDPDDATAPADSIDVSGSHDVDAEITELSYEQARDELVAIVSRLEAGSASLEESMQLWGRGEKLAKHCQQWLDSAEQKLDASEPDAEA
jgi:exodeoxyribonuclease VII small subunit